MRRALVAAIAAGFVCIVSGPPPASGAAPTASASDAKLRDALIGTWQIDLPREQFPFRKGFSTYYRDGRIVQIGLLENSGFGARWEIEGTWTVDNGVLIESPTKATPPTRLGPVAKTKIVSLDSDRLMLRDGARVVELRRARVPENLPPISRWVFAMARSAEQRKLFGIETRNPSYPKVTQLKRIEGDGVFRISVNGQGRVAGIEILESTGNATLDGAAVAAFQRWRFTPRTVKELVVPVSFRMRGF